jgi:hypothetical protein
MTGSFNIPLSVEVLASSTLSPKIQISSRAIRNFGGIGEDALQTP